MYTIDCFAGISTQEECTVTQKLDLDQMSERSMYLIYNIYYIIHTLKDSVRMILIMIFDIKQRKKCPRNFLPPLWILLKTAFPRVYIGAGFAPGCDPSVRVNYLTFAARQTAIDPILPRSNLFYCFKVST